MFPYLDYVLVVGASGADRDQENTEEVTPDARGRSSTSSGRAVRTERSLS